MRLIDVERFCADKEEPERPIEGQIGMEEML